MSEFSMPRDYDELHNNVSEFGGLKNTRVGKSAYSGTKKESKARKTISTALLMTTAAATAVLSVVLPYLDLRVQELSPTEATVQVYINQGSSQEDLDYYYVLYEGDGAQELDSGTVEETDTLIQLSNLKPGTTYKMIVFSGSSPNCPDGKLSVEKIFTTPIGDRNGPPGGGEHGQQPGGTPTNPPTATPSATPSATPTATPSPTPSATPSPTPSATPIPYYPPAPEPPIPVGDWIFNESAYEVSPVAQAVSYIGASGGLFYMDNHFFLPDDCPTNISFGATPSTTTARLTIILDEGNENGCEQTIIPSNSSISVSGGYVYITCAGSASGIANTTGSLPVTTKITYKLPSDPNTYQLLVVDSFTPDRKAAVLGGSEYIRTGEVCTAKITLDISQLKLTELRTGAIDGTTYVGKLTLKLLDGAGNMVEVPWTLISPAVLPVPPDTFGTITVQAPVNNATLLASQPLPFEVTISSNYTNTVGSGEVTASETVTGTQTLTGSAADIT